MLRDETILALGMPGGPELLIILAVVLLFFGRKIPGVARSLGSGITEFKKGLREGEESTKQLKDELEQPPKDIDADVK